MIDPKDSINKIIDEVKSIRSELNKLASTIHSRRLESSISIINEVLANVRDKVNDIILQVDHIPSLYVERWLIIKQLNVVLSHIDLVLNYAKVIIGQVERNIISEYRLKREEDYIIRHIKYIIEALEDVLKNLSNILLTLK